MGRYMANNKGAYVDHSSGLWFCFICKAMAPSSSINRSWIDRGVTLGKTPGRAFKRHFKSSFHEDCVKKRTLLDKASSKGKEKSIITMMKNICMTNEELTTTRNQAFVKVCFRVVNHIVHSVFPNKSFESLVELIASCGSEQVKKHLLTCAQNAKYTSSTMFTKYLEIINKYIEEPLLHSLRNSQLFTLSHDDTTDITKHSQAGIFMTFEHKLKISEHFVGIENMTALVAGLTALDLFNGIFGVTERLKVDLRKNAFSEMDGAPVNDGDENGLKTYFEALNPFHIHETCNSHGLALIPKHLITNSWKYSCIQAADRLMVSLYVFFKDSSLRISVLERTQIVLALKVLMIF